MPTLIAHPAVVEAAGNKPKLIEEFFGRVNSSTADLSIARMTSPGGWVEPGQTPEFDEYTVVLHGVLRVTSTGGALDVLEGQAVLVEAGEWVQYSTPEEGGAEYVAVCVPAFAPQAVHRDATPTRVTQQARVKTSARTKAPAGRKKAARQRARGRAKPGRAR